MSVLEVTVMLVISAAMIIATAMRWWPIGWMEVLGFTTGGVCVWLVVREHMWNWPLGLANNVIFFLLFWREKLYADAGLQPIYFVLGVYGWLHWKHGGIAHTELRVTRTPPRELLLLIAIIPLATLALRELLIHVNGSAPLLDALTTVLCLVAQWLICRKRIENWFFWMIADVIYIPLYISKQLPLTALLYSVLLVMCVAGLRAWWRSLRLSESTGVPLTAVGALP